MSQKTHKQTAVKVERKQGWRGVATLIKLRSRTRDGWCANALAPTTASITAAMPRLSLYKSCRVVLEPAAYLLKLTRQRATTILRVSQLLPASASTQRHATYHTTHTIPHTTATARSRP